ncbi:MAG: ABC transporter permease [Bacteroidota bacterium]
MYKLWATFIKDLRVLSRDRVGLTLMFVMPIILVIVITSLQASTFELVNENKIQLIVCNKDAGELGKQFIHGIFNAGLSNIADVSKELTQDQVSNIMHEKDALIAIIIPVDFSSKILEKATGVSSKALTNMGVEGAVSEYTIGESVTLFYNPVLQKSYLQSINGALLSALQLVESKQILNSIYFSLNETKIPEALEQDILTNRIKINEIPVSKNGSKSIPNATQHNIPAWTIFAMFFVVTSLGSNVVKEKLSGSFVRLKTLPTNYLLSLLSKQITYIAVCLLQVVVIFSIGVGVFPLIGLPALNLPSDLFSLFIVSLCCGWCAVSYAICIGVFAQSQEQANGFGAVSIVILAALGGILVPSFAMPNSFHMLMQLSPLHWCLESYYELFLEGGAFSDVFKNIFPVICITLVIQILTLIKLKKIQII